MVFWPSHDLNQVNTRSLANKDIPLIKHNMFETRKNCLADNVQEQCHNVKVSQKMLQQL